MKSESSKNLLHHLQHHAIYPDFDKVISRRLLFVLGKGGVGKSVISQALALYRSQNDLESDEQSSEDIAPTRQSPVLHICFEDPTVPTDSLQKVKPKLWQLNASAQKCFEEYIQLKLKLPKVTSILLKNKMIQYLSHATPGVKEVVLLGKAWAERMNYRQVICDMPATGHGLAMFKCVHNFTELFRGSIISTDAKEMLSTFSNPKKTGFLIVSLPEEMPLRESQELAQNLKTLFPDNPPAFLVNKLFKIEEPEAPNQYNTGHHAPKSKPSNMPLTNENPETWGTPIASSSDDYIQKRIFREKWNLREWKKEGVPYIEVPYLLDRLSSKQMATSSFDQLIHSIFGYFSSRKQNAKSEIKNKSFTPKPNFTKGARHEGKA